MSFSRDQLSAALGPKVRALNPDLAGPEALTPRPPSQADQREAALHEEIRLAAVARGYLVFHGSMAQRTHRTEGEPDFVIFAEYPVALMVEAKTRTGKLSPAQQAVAAHAAKLGWRVYLVRTLEDFRLALAAEVSKALPNGRLDLISQLYPKGM